MYLVLTHEQADFDGIAATFAVHLLDPEALPVLPRRVNRNVRGFLTLYGEQLPFHEHDDLPAGRIERVTLVDTQNLASIKGLTERTQVHVIDHHPAAEGLPARWTTHISEVGATTTLLVDELRERGIELGFVAATLLLLGIYEDTGSLTYAGTTPADLAAGAWLLEAGARLSIAADFLNQPLSKEQRELYERLLEEAETHEFHGLSVVLAGGQAAGMVDEISTLAHKLRDVFDPAGLFVLVAMENHVQLVARSTSDAVDVARIAQRLGGGGHSRAAAALIREQSLAEVRERLLELLPEVVEPPTRVRELMSRDPHLLAPETKIDEAARRMQRSGHEGYPIVNNEGVVGLLTRRAVDRAMAHGMGGRPVSSVMDAGDLVVHPRDSVEHLQRLMIRHGWGQVPVADPGSGEIIGIVTRTDLLRTMGEGATGPGQVNLADRLERALPPVRLALLKHIAEAAEEREVALYIVGGFVRDLILGTPSVDFDLVTEGDAIRLAQAVADQYGGSVSSHRRFGTAKWQLSSVSARLEEALAVDSKAAGKLPESLDFVTARSEFYLHPTALPTVERGSIKLDLHRRDFTINTLALRLDGRFYGQLLDHWGGGQDLQDGVIRVLHSLSFVDDPTRMLRAVRLEQRLDFTIERRTMELLLDARSLLDRVSGDRIRSELDLIFAEEALPAIMDRLAELELLAAIHPAITWDNWLQDRWRRIAEFDPPARWGLAAEPEKEVLYFTAWTYRLPRERAREVCRRLHLPGRARDAVIEAGSIGDRLEGTAASRPPSEIVALLEDTAEKALVGAWLMLDEQEARAAIDRYLSHWRQLEPIANGQTLKDLGLPPGPAYARILRQLRAGWLNEEITSESEERAALERLLEREMKDG